MTYSNIKDFYLSAVASVTSRIGQYSVHPGKDFSRNRKISPDTLISFLVSQGSSSSRVEMLDFWDFDPSMPSLSAFSQQRAKLKPEALEAVFSNFNSRISQSVDIPDSDPDFRYLAADGSTTSFFSRPAFAPEKYFCSPGSSIKGVYSIHINAFFDLDSCTYTSAILQAVHEKNEFGAFCDMVDHHEILSGKKNVYIGDRGYCSYNNMAHVLEQGQYFLFRSKDIHSKGLVANFDFPSRDCFDIDVPVTLVRRNSRKISVDPGSYRRFIGQDATFDFIEYGSSDTYTMKFRIVRVQLDNGSFECLVTNLPRDRFPPEKLKALYYRRWGIETSFRKLKYTIGLSNYHSCKPDYVKQEIWARLLAYNITELFIDLTAIETQETTHEYKVNFTRATHICRVFLRPHTEKDQHDVRLLLQRELIPVRNERKYPRLQTAHFRRPRYLIYRAA